MKGCRTISPGTATLMENEAGCNLPGMEDVASVVRNFEGGGNGRRHIH